MVESTGLENRHTLIAYLGFKSLSLRHTLNKKAVDLSAAFLYLAEQKSPLLMGETNVSVRATF